MDKFRCPKLKKLKIKELFVRVSSSNKMGFSAALRGDGGTNQGLHMLPKDLLSNDVWVPLAYKRHPLYKTELCRKWQTMYFCTYGIKCQFAHGIVEMRTTAKHAMYKTRPCYWLMKGIACPYGTRCAFIHPDDI